MVFQLTGSSHFIGPSACIPPSRRLKTVSRYQRASPRKDSRLGASSAPVGNPIPAYLPTAPRPTPNDAFSRAPEIQPAVVGIRPAGVGAHEACGIAIVAADHAVAAVPAHIKEGVELTL